MAAIANKNETLFCGSTLIGDQWVVTASHCLFKKADGTDPRKADELRIILGEHDINSTTESNITRKTVLVSKIITHEDYNAEESVHDVALLKLAEPVDLNVYTPACVAKAGDIFVGKNASVYGEKKNMLSIIDQYFKVGERLVLEEFFPINCKRLKFQLSLQKFASWRWIRLQKCV